MSISRPSQGAAPDLLTTTRAAYAAFVDGDFESAMSRIGDDVEWVVRGDHRHAGTKRGRSELTAWWTTLSRVGVHVTPRRFLADGDAVVVLSDLSVGDARTTQVDVLDFDGSGRLMRFEGFGAEGTLARALAAPTLANETTTVS